MPWQNTPLESINSESLGFELPGGHPTPIIPLIIGDNSKVLRLSEFMLSRGVFCHGIRYPTVPEEKAMLRLTIMATHSQEDLDLGLRSLEEGLKEVGL